MVTVFKIKFSSNVNWIVPSDESFLNTITHPFDGRAKSKIWGEPSFYVHGDPERLETDFFSLASGAIAFSEKVKLAPNVISHLEIAGEILPVYMEHGPSFYVLNVTEIVNPLNQNDCLYEKFPSGRKGRILKYSFHPNRFSESSIFKIPETKEVDILTLCREKGGAEDYFYQAYQESGLRGLDFEEIWSDGK